MPALYPTVMFDEILFGVLPFGIRGRTIKGMTTGAPSNPEAENRRHQLRRWIDHFFGGSQAAFGASTASTEKGERQINQGELSALLKSKSFGEKRARSLELQAQMPRGYLDSTSPPDAQVLTPFLRLQSPLSAVDKAIAPPIVWPFKLVSYGRVRALQKALGPRRATEALNEIDGYLDAMMRKWEGAAGQAKKSNGGD